MNVFDIRERLVADYRDYIQSFIRIQDPKIRANVEEELGRGLLWPEPLIQLNPAFEPGRRIDDLVKEGHLHPQCSQVFRIGKTDTDSGRPLRLHRHQEEALLAANTRRSYVLTTGTGSGKSLTYIIPIVDHVLRRGSGRGIQAIVVYPMNALANSQMGELEKFLGHGFSQGYPVTFARYTGQEDDERRQQILANPPDILLTNYVMLELILTRPYENKLIEAARGLRFLVFDELHTYRGRQGSDVALLIRRVRDLVAQPTGEGDSQESLQCVGTSATLAGSGTWPEVRRQVADVATQLFGALVRPEEVLGETLRRSTPESNLDDPAFQARLKARLAETGVGLASEYETFLADPLSIWLESTFGVTTEPGSGRLVRSEPRPVTGPGGAARELVEQTGVPEPRCAEAIRQGLLAGYRATDPDTGFPAFAFRVHQFLSRGDTVHASPEAEDLRHITLHKQTFVPGNRKRRLLPLVFCRECGQEYYCVRRVSASRGRAYIPRELSDRLTDEESEAGFLYLSTLEPWPTDTQEEIERLPDEWLELHRGAWRVRRARRNALPQPVQVVPDGREAEEGLHGCFLPVPFRFCLRCGVAYYWHLRTDFGKLATLATEGRSTATSLLALSALRHLRQQGDLGRNAQKLLSFTDNRQDASLQTGHFNDFVAVGLLRGALQRAVEASGDHGLAHDELTQRVFSSLNLSISDFAQDPEVQFVARTETERTLRDVLGYRLYRDLRRGWRVTSPNLEQCGLLSIRYTSLKEACSAPELWEGAHEALSEATPETREEVAQTLLDFMRRELAVAVDYLEPGFQERLILRSHRHLREPWALDDGEKLEPAVRLFPRARTPRQDSRADLFLGPRSTFNQYLRRPGVLTEAPALSPLEAELITLQLLEALRRAGIVTVAEPAANDDEVAGYQINAAALKWHAGDGRTIVRDPIRVPRAPADPAPPNEFFVRFYRDLALSLRGLEAREHTAQVPAEERQKREERFRSADLPLLFCSPTMELGVDIAELNMVNLRNVPPTPANYAQRSGRAGRSGQPALVFTYCATGSPHDQWFFKRPHLMVAGKVKPPRLDLANEDLVRSHVHAVWLRETGETLGKTLDHVLDLSGTPPELGLLPGFRDALADPGARARAQQRAKSILESLESNLGAAGWYTPEWLDEVFHQLEAGFEATCDRWRSLYEAAWKQAQEQHDILMDASRSRRDKDKAKNLWQQARAQLELLTEPSRAYESDFSSYRYFASEGFLPGYNFPRLPMSAFIPGRRHKKGEEEYLSRPRFLAISEFGPQSLVYHEGSRYAITRAILPVSDEEALTVRAKRCGVCGYLHPMDGAAGADVCELCGTKSLPTLQRLFRLQNVSTVRRDKISSDEEERLRLGFEVRTGFRFEARGHGPAFRRARVRGVDGTELADLIYTDAANLWRINLGWKRRERREELGFVLDLENGIWGKHKQLVEDDPEDAMSPRRARVIPYVEDHKNCLLWRPVGFPPEDLASLQAALKNALQVVFQLEDGELAAERLPDSDTPTRLLFYEAAEGGAGVLRRLLDDPESLTAVASTSLELCHFDPETGADRRRAEGAREDCEAACYDCLMSYSNQPDHDQLDRQRLRDHLLTLRTARVEVAPGERPRTEHLEALLARCDSDLERRWLRFLESRELRLPTASQKLVEECATRPDFLYLGTFRTAVFIDGPAHDDPQQKQKDAQADECLEDRGWLVLRFRWDEEEDGWAERVGQFGSVFGAEVKT